VEPEPGVGDRAQSILDEWNWSQKLGGAETILLFHFCQMNVVRNSVTCSAHLDDLITLWI